jgi:hypothetical protein
LKLAAGSIFVIILLILSFSPLNTDVQAIAAAETATSIEVLLGTVFPYLWVFIIIMFCGVAAFDVMKGGH